MQRLFLTFDPVGFFIPFLTFAHLILLSFVSSQMHFLFFSIYHSLFLPSFQLFFFQFLSIIIKQNDTSQHSLFVFCSKVLKTERRIDKQINIKIIIFFSTLLIDCVNSAKRQCYLSKSFYSAEP